MIKYYILDMDGTLCDSMIWWRRETAHITDFTDRDTVMKTFSKMREHYRIDIMPKPGLFSALGRARAAGIKMCIATATRRDVAQPFLDRTGIMEYMEFYIDCYDVGEFKESPAVYLAAAERLGAEIGECAVFEDAAYCMETARRAGFRVVGVYDEVAAGEGDVRGNADIFLEGWSGFEVEKI